VPIARPLLASSMEVLYSYSLSESDAIAESSEILSRKLLASIPAEDLPISVFKTWLALPPLEPDCTLEQLRRQCNSIMIGFRVVTWTFEHCQVTDSFVLDMVQAMKEVNATIRAANDDVGIKNHLRRLIQGNQVDKRGAANGNGSQQDRHGQQEQKLQFANAVIDMVQCTDDQMDPAFGRLEIVGETAFLDSLVNGAANPNVSEATKDFLFSTATEIVVAMVHDATASLADIKSSKSSDAFWLQKCRVSMSAESLVLLTKIPRRYWVDQKNDILSCASQLVKSPDASVRKSVSVFFQGLNH
jgi:hypothetical protein